jgi:CheY-like chemotaxis protein
MHANSYVLVVEDDSAIQESLKDALELGGFRVLTADNGKEALKILEAPAAPCMIFLDLMMPVMDGWEFIDAVEKTPAISSVPIIVLSAVANKRAITSQSVRRVIPKPILVDHLLQTAKEFC